jgi:hypothetical protein
LFFFFFFFLLLLHLLLVDNSPISIPANIIIGDSISSQKASQPARKESRMKEG